MARAGYMNAKQAVEKARGDFAYAQERLSQAEALPATTEAERAVRAFHVSDAQRAFNERREILAGAEKDWESFKASEPLKRRGPQRHFTGSRPVMLSAKQEMFDAIDAHCAVQRISLPELLRRAITAYLKLDEKQKGPVVEDNAAF